MSPNLKLKLKNIVIAYRVHKVWIEGHTNEFVMLSKSTYVKTTESRIENNYK